MKLLGTTTTFKPNFYYTVYDIIWYDISVYIYKYEIIYIYIYIHLKTIVITYINIWVQIIFDIRVTHFLSHICIHELYFLFLNINTSLLFLVYFFFIGLLLLFILTLVLCVTSTHLVQNRQTKFQTVQYTIVSLSLRKWTPLLLDSRSCLVPSFEGEFCLL